LFSISCTILGTHYVPHAYNGHAHDYRLLFENSERGKEQKNLLHFVSLEKREKGKKIGDTRRRE